MSLVLLTYVIIFRNGSEAQGNIEIFNSYETLSEAVECFEDLEAGYSPDGWNHGYKAASQIVRLADNGDIYDPFTEECVGTIYD